jgi:hypothetical protein
LQEKIDPYLRPLYDALFDMLEPERVERYLEKNIIEIAPIAFMRGRTLNDSFVILDEAQNTTSEQMKMFVTRLGFNSKAVITGDVTQIDLPSARRSGLIEAVEILQGVNGLAFVHFDESDVVRHHLVQRIIRAYDEHKDGWRSSSCRCSNQSRVEVRCARGEHCRGSSAASVFTGPEGRAPPALEGCGKARDSYQGIALAMPSASELTPLQALGVGEN